MTLQLEWRLIDPDNTLTVESCAALALERGWRLFALQVDLCYVTNDLERATALGESEWCGDPCPGNFRQVCGGIDTNSVYQVVRS
eukprot:349960-Chlamydomonas_euryale.AAC.4